MTIDKRIYCTAEIEPKSFYSQDKVSISVGLGFECLGEGDNPKEVIKDFVTDKLQNLIFKVFKYNTIKKYFELLESEVTTEKHIVPDYRANLFTWLVSRGKEAKEYDDFWWTKKELEVQREFSADHLTASLLLRSALSWPAPLPHKCGLMQLVKVKDTTMNAVQEDDKLIVLPFLFLNEDKIPKSIGLGHDFEPDVGTPVCLSYDPGNGYGEIQCITNILEKINWEEMGLVDRETGFLKISPSSDETRRFLDKFEETTGSRLWPLPMLLQEEVKKETKPDLSGAVWLAVAGLATALDPILIALMMPLSNGEEAAGPILDKFRSPGQQDIRENLQNNSPLLSKAINKEGYCKALAFTLDLGEIIKETPDKEDKYVLLRTMLSYFIKHESKEDIDKNNKNITKIFGDDFYEQLGSELLEVLHTLQQESGVEQAIIRIFEYGDNVIPDTDPVAAEAWQGFKQTLLGPFNGAEAVRRANGIVFRNALVKDPEKADNKWLESLYKSDYFVQRLYGDSDDNIFAAITEIFPKPALNLFPFPDKQESILSSQFTALMDEWFPKNTDPVRFVPDHAPEPLPIQIAASSAATQLENFNTRFNGFGFAIKDSKTTNWACASLAELDIYRETLTKSLVVLPLAPALINGIPQIYLEYNGFPLAHTIFKDTLPQGAETGSQPDPFYTVELADHVADHVDGGASGYAKPPRLIYGHTYQVSAFAVSQYGALPGSLRDDRDKNEPWKLKPDFSPPKSTNPKIVAEYTYLRRTAIGQISIIEDSKGKPARIGAAVAGVQPLANDYPRLALVCNSNAAGVLDVFRHSDGTGSLAFNDDISDFTVKLTDIKQSKNVNQLAVSLHCKVSDSYEDKGCEEKKIEWEINNDSELIFHFSREEGENGDSFKDTVVVKGNGNKSCSLKNNPTEKNISYWIRLKTNSNNDDVQVISFATPAADGGAMAGGIRQNPPPLLLIAKRDDESVFREEFQDKVTAKITLPRVGYHDFERWFSKELQVNVRPDEQNNKEYLSDALLMAYIARTLDEKIGQRLDNLPDLAVGKLMVELTILDTLNGNFDESKVSIIEAPSLAEFCNDQVKILQDITEVKPDDKSDDIRKMIGTLLEELDNHYTLVHMKELQIQCLDDTLKIDTTSGIVATIPEGTVALLSIRPMVKKEYFLEGNSKQRFHLGLKQLALGEYQVVNESGKDNETYVVFNGTSITVEAMLSKKLGFFDSTLIKNFKVRPAASARTYDLVLDGDPAKQLSRLYGKVEVHTQRWRPSGRPIYTWIDPKNGTEADHAALEIHSEHQNLAQFEGEAFYGRPDDDADTVSKIIDPQPGDTIVQTFSWHQPSAAYFRHKPALFSRYGDFYKTLNDAIITSWNDQDGEKQWAMRVVMLADQSRFQLTRPQLRALIPLTAALGAQSVPPVCAILQEPPFAFGGLADRISTAIKTGFNYGFPSKDKDSTVNLTDSRKEAGPDPRLAYRPLPEEEALGLALEMEGPVGLTFDSPGTPAPVFANTMLSLQLRNFNDASGGSSDFEEHFIAISLRRYLAPEWLFAKQQTLNSKALTFDSCYWMEFGETGTIWLNNRDENKKILKIYKDGDSWVCKLTKCYIDESASGEPVPVCKASTTQIKSLAVLHVSQGGGRASLSIFGLPKPLAKNQTVFNSLPVMLASFDWSVPGKSDAAQSHLLYIVGTKRIATTSASAATFMNWTRTNRNFDHIHYVKERDATKTSSASYDDNALSITVSDDANKMKFHWKNKEVRLLSKTSLTHYPLHVHRHLAAIITCSSQGIGREFDIFHQAVRINGLTVPLVKNISKEELTNAKVRIVELETPAAILNPSKELESQYGKCYFDLKAIGKENPKNGLLFIIRFVSPKVFTKITVKITKAGTNYSSISKSLSFSADNKKLSILEFKIKDNGSKLTALDTFGEVIPSEEPKKIHQEENSTSALFSTDGLYLEIKDIEGNGVSEVWCDVSMLTLPDQEHALSFDWCFTDQEQEHDPAMLTSPADLTGMVEAQARIISVSPAIPILGQEKSNK